MKHWKSIFYLILLLSGNTFAQKGLSPGISFGYISDNLLGVKSIGSEFEGPVNNSEQIDFIGEFNYGYTYGLKLRHGFNKSFEIETGITKIYRNLTLWNFSQVTGGGVGSVVNIRLVEVPLTFLYKRNISKSKELLLINAIGLSNTILINYPEKEIASESGSLPFTVEYGQSKSISSFVYSLGIQKERSRNRGVSYYGMSVHLNFKKSMRFDTHNNFYGRDFQRSRFSYLSFDYKYFLPWRNKLRWPRCKCQDEN